MSLQIKQSLTSYNRGFITLHKRVAPDPKGGDSFKKGGVPTPNVSKGFSGDEGQKSDSGGRNRLIIKTTEAFVVLSSRGGKKGLTELS